jgi:hypothetical protein
VNPSVSQWTLGYHPRKRCASYFAALVHLGERIDHAGRVEISHKALGIRLNLCARQVQTIMAELAREGRILITKQFDRKSGAQLSNVYRLLAPWVQRMIDGEMRDPIAKDAPEAEPAVGTGVLHAPDRIEAPRPAPPWFSSWLTANGGCRDGDVACDECRAHG